jgi:UDP-N-acetylmuramoylalanine--D-glutamate ligase
MKVALAGFGQEGRTSYDYWTAKGDTVTIADERESVDDAPPGAPTILGANAFSRLNEFDLIIRSPSVNPAKLPYPNKVWSATNEFFAKCPADIIGVTGTKGKGTTSSLIVSILRAANKTVHLVGNIGNPALDDLAVIKPNDIVVFEMSSFQLWDIKKSPRVAVVLGIEADHLDVHNDMADYVSAKANIVRFQQPTNLTVYNQDNEVASRIAALSPAQTTGYIDRTIMDKYGPSLVIPGPHNIENAAAAVSAVLPFVQDEAIIKQGLREFSGLPHRIKFIREVKGVRYYDDSYSSAPAAAIAALRSFDTNKIVILGGYEKHADFSHLAEYIANDPLVRTAIVIGQTRHRIEEALIAAGVVRHRFISLDTVDFKEIVRRTSEEAQPGDVVVLSPACASFDMFKNFTDRGDQFIQLVGEL